MSGIFLSLLRRHKNSNSPQFIVHMYSQYSNSALSTSGEIEISNEEVSEEAILELEAEIEKKRNKSSLLPQHLNILHGIPPYNTEKDVCHYTMKNKRRMYGRYGFQSGINPATLWPTKEELKEIKEYELVAYPYSINEMRKQEENKRMKELTIIRDRQKQLAQNVKKLNDWKKELEQRAAKKLADSMLAKQRKEALIEEVRRHFGFKIDQRDERFKEVYLQKEKDQKKKLKEEKMKAKQEKLMAVLARAE